VQIQLESVDTLYQILYTQNLLKANTTLNDFILQCSELTHVAKWEVFFNCVQKEIIEPILIYNNIGIQLTSLCEILNQFSEYQKVLKEKYNTIKPETKDREKSITDELNIAKEELKTLESLLCNLDATLKALKNEAQTKGLTIQENTNQEMQR
jgi:hypothetical protein